MEVRKIKIEEIKEYENNPVIHSKEQINKLAQIFLFLRKNYKEKINEYRKD